jgi:predicted outer membrane repeat protein
MKPLGLRVRAMLGSTLVPASVGAAVVAPSPAGAVSEVVLFVNGTSGTETTGCTGPGADACQTIQEGVSAADALSGDEVTVTVAPGSYTGPVDATSAALAALTVRGAGASSTTVSGGDTTEDFFVTSGVVTISELAVDSGRAAYGGGVIDVDATVTLTDDTLTGDSSAIFGGAVFVADGGTATLVDDTLSDDSAGATGGAVANDDGRLFMTDDTLVGDSTTGYGGGIASNSEAVLTDDTFSENSADTGGAVAAAGDTTLTFDTAPRTSPTP